MTKDTYLKIVEQENIPMEVFFEYYKERGGTLTDLDEFSELFSTAISNQWTVKTSSGMKKITYTSVLNNFYSYYNNKFGLNEYTRNTTGGGNTFFSFQF